MRAEEEKIRIEKARAALLKLAQGVPMSTLQIFDGPAVEWQLRLLKRLHRESMVSVSTHGYHANSIRMVALLKAAAANTPAIVELLWPERAKEVLKGLAKLAPMPMPDPTPTPPPRVPFNADEAATAPAPAPSAALVLPPPLPPRELDPAEMVVVTLRTHGPTTKRDLQDKIGGKRQYAQQAVEDALDQGLCLFGHLPGHARARVYLQEHLDAIEAAVVETPEPEPDVANATESEAAMAHETEPGADDVDDYTFKSTTLKYIVIYGQNFIAVAEHFRLLHETTARLETKLDALLERLEKRV